MRTSWWKLLLALAAGTAILAPVAFAVRVSFSPDSSLTYSPGEWSFRWYRAYFADRRWIDATLRSFIVATLAATVAALAGTPLAMAIVHHRFPGRSAIAAAAILPACVPPAVLAMGLLPAFYAARMAGTLGGLILAHALLGLPACYLIAKAHLEQIGVGLDEVARGLGASPWQASRRITLPLIRPTVIAGAAVAFIGSFNESMITMFLTTPLIETLPAMVWPQLRYAASPLVAVASCIGALLAALGAALVMRFLRNRGGRGGI